MFDSDPAGRKQSSKGHRVMRSVENPNEVFVRVDFDSVEEGRTFREGLLASGALDNVTIVKEPTVVEVAERGHVLARTSLPHGPVGGSRNYAELHPATACA